MIDEDMVISVIQDAELEHYNKIGWAKNFTAFTKEINGFYLMAVRFNRFTYPLWFNDGYGCAGFISSFKFETLPQKGVYRIAEDFIDLPQCIEALENLALSNPVLDGDKGYIALQDFYNESLKNEFVIK